jgi:hypothetical protein
MGNTLSEEIEGPIQFDHRFKFTFHTSWLEPCHKCRTLNGRTFEGTSIYAGVLWDAVWGDIWDIENDLPLTHPNCKCYLEVTYESTLDELLHPSLIETFERGGSKVTVARDIATGRFTKINPFQEFGIMTSNIKEMKAELADFDRDLARASNRIDNTKFQLMTYMTLLNQLGLPPEVDRVISILTRVRMTFELTTRSAYLLMAASGPLGWAMAGASMGISLVSAYGIAVDLGGQ